VESAIFEKILKKINIAKEERNISLKSILIGCNG